MRVLLSLLLSAAMSHGAETYVVSVGVSAYRDPALPSLKYAVQDAEAFAKVYRDRGVASENITLLTTAQRNSAQQPTQTSILRSLERVRERVVPGDTVILFFAGHGIQKGENVYLLTPESERARLARTGLPVRLLEAVRRGMDTDQVLFVVDACRNDPDNGRNSPPAPVNPLLQSGGSARVDLAMLLACDVGQRAWEMSAQQHGAFTYFLLKGLNGAARGDDGTVKMSDLADYVMTEVPRWAERANRDQRPRLTLTEPMDFVVLPAASAAVYYTAN